MTQLLNIDCLDHTNYKFNIILRSRCMMEHMSHFTQFWERYIQHSRPILYLFVTKSWIMTLFSQTLSNFGVCENIIINDDTYQFLLCITNTSGRQWKFYMLGLGHQTLKLKYARLDIKESNLNKRNMNHTIINKVILVLTLLVGLIMNNMIIYLKWKGKVRGRWGVEGGMDVF